MKLKQGLTMIAFGAVVGLSGGASVASEPVETLQDTTVETVITQEDWQNFLSVAQVCSIDTMIASFEGYDPETYMTDCFDSNTPTSQRASYLQNCVRN